jgi:hypothetical protein
MSNKIISQEELAQQALLLDEIIVNIAYAKAMAAVAIGADFNQFTTTIIHDFLGGIHSVLERVGELQQAFVTSMYQLLQQAGLEEEVNVKE